MLHYLIGNLRHADGACPPSSKGANAFDIFAGVSSNSSMGSTFWSALCMYWIRIFQVHPPSFWPYLRLVILFHDFSRVFVISSQILFQGFLKNIFFEETSCRIWNIECKYTYITYSTYTSYITNMSYKPYESHILQILRIQYMKLMYLNFTLFTSKLHIWHYYIHALTL